MILIDNSRDTNDIYIYMGGYFLSLTIVRVYPCCFLVILVYLFSLDISHASSVRCFSVPCL